MSQTTYNVAGMHCNHCAEAVTEEISAISGVQCVDVDVASGRVTVESDTPLSTDDVRAAVAEAGYQLAS